MPTGNNEKKSAQLSEREITELENQIGGDPK
jgi:hypothetical protein